MNPKIKIDNNLIMGLKKIYDKQKEKMSEQITQLNMSTDIRFEGWTVDEMKIFILGMSAAAQIAEISFDLQDFKDIFSMASMSLANKIINEEGAAKEKEMVVSE